MLIEVAENVWIAEGACVDFRGFPYSTRCVIVRLPSGALWGPQSAIDKLPDLHFDGRLKAGPSET